MIREQERQRGGEKALRTQEDSQTISWAERRRAAEKLNGGKAETQIPCWAQMRDSGEGARRET